jgi:hypothetical protein
LAGTELPSAALALEVEASWATPNFTRDQAPDQPDGGGKSDLGEERIADELSLNSRFGSLHGRLASTSSTIHIRVN